jgi:peptide/nickel transport system substrate-binding protein
MWPDGQVFIEPRSWLVIYPQFNNPSPAVISDVRFRRAMLMGIDRQQMVETIQQGLVPVADSYVSPSYRDYAAIAPHLVRYDYDPARARRMIEELGYGRGADGTYRDPANRPLQVELRAIGDGAFQEKSLYTIADYWGQLGVATDPVIIPRQRQPEREYRATYPGFEQLRQPNNLSELSAFHGSRARLPETNYAGTNYPAYRNVEWDALLERYDVTIALAERNQVLGQLMRHLSEQLPIMPLFHDADVSPFPKRMINVTPSRGEVAAVTWNASEWDFK